MGKTRNHYLVRNHLDDEEVTIYDDTTPDDWFENEPSMVNELQHVQEDESWLYKSTCNKNEQQTNTTESKPWSGIVVKGIPSLYQLALDALPSKTRMQVSRLILPDPTRN